MSTATEKTPSSFVVPEGFTVEINGVERVFYAMSLKTVFQLRSIAKPILTSLASIFGSTQQSLREVYQAGEVTKKTFEPLPSDTLKGEVLAREKAIADLTDALLDPRNAELFRLLLTDSLRDDYPRPVKLTKEQIAELEELDVPTAIEFLGGVFQANKGIFAPLAKGVREAKEAVAPLTPVAMQSGRNGSASSS